MIRSLAQKPVRPLVVVEIPNAGDAGHVATVIVGRASLLFKVGKILRRR